MGWEWGYWSLSNFLTLGIIYFVVMIVAAFSYRVPPKDWKPEGWEPKESSGQSMITKKHAYRSSLFHVWQLWIMLCFNVTAGIGVIGLLRRY